MLRLDEIVGQGSAIKTLMAGPGSGAPAGAWLFAGPDGVGKKTTALAWARALFCRTEGARGCGQCGPCVKIEHGNFPDLVSMAPEIHNRKVKEEIDIASVRQFIANLGWKPYEADRKMAILDGADKMNITAANALLKTLEEPPGQTTIVLIASNMNSLLPTIISRCRTVRFRPLPFADMTQLLMDRRGLDEGKAQAVAAMSKGAPGRAQVETVESAMQIRAEALKFLENGPTAPCAAYRLARAMDKPAMRARTDKFLSTVQELVRDMLVMKISGKYDNLINVDIAQAIETTAVRYSARKLLIADELVNDLVMARRWNINPFLVITTLALELYG